MTRLKQSLILFVMMGFSYISQAHDYTGDLNEAASSTDFHTVWCSSDTAQMYFDIVSFKPSSSDIIVSAKVISENTFAVSDASSTDANKSIGIDVPTTNGVLILVSKNKSGKVGYTIDFHCQSGTGEHTETALNTLQNQ